MPDGMTDTERSRWPPDPTLDLLTKAHWRREELELGYGVGFGLTARAQLRWAAGDRLSLTLRYLFNRTRVVAATVAPDLVGRRLAQVPRHVATLAGEWRPGPGWS